MIQQKVLTDFHIRYEVHKTKKRYLLLRQPDCFIVASSDNKAEMEELQKDIERRIKNNESKSSDVV